MEKMLLDSSLDNNCCVCAKCSLHTVAVDCPRCAQINQKKQNNPCEDHESSKTGVETKQI